MRSKLRARTWAIPALKRAGFEEHELVKIYCTTMRPTVEYCSPAWGFMITSEQDHIFERQQTQAVKHIFGPKISEEKLREMANVPTLSQRRRNAALRFACKSRDNPRFSHWFNERPVPERGRRLSASYRRYKESRFRTDRFMNSPLNHLRRIRNEDENKTNTC